MPLDNLRIVLVETSHPGNIGAAARAMKTMGLAELVLVNPAAFPSAPATARAAGADDLLYHARVVDSLDAALADCSFACATTARRRELSLVPRPPRDVAPELLERSRSGKVAVVFGRERSGLANEELLRCQACVEIPANTDYASLNLAAAVQVIAYELRLAAMAATSTRGGSAPAQAVPVAPAAPPRDVVGVADLEGLYAHLERALVVIGYHDPARPRKLMARLRALFARADLDRAELQILRGILTAAEARAREAAGGRVDMRSAEDD